MNRIRTISQYVALITLLLFTVNSSAQDLAMPLNIPLKMSGNFGEIRPNHFHSGVDFKTEGKQGLEVVAVADGYVSRVKVSPYGFGKALYLQHDNGLTSVYAHLRSYETVLDDHIKKEQYRNESFTIELFPEKDQFRYKKGDVIAYSGNSGGSAGPHLHFELRNSANQHPINPSAKGIYSADERPPIPKALYLYDLHNASLSLLETKPQKIELTALKSGNFAVANTIKLETPCAFGLEALDKANGAENRLGIYDIAFIIGDQTIYRKTMESFSFDETRYCNAHLDYSYKKKIGRRIQRLHKLPNDDLSVYSSLKSNGIIDHLKKDSTYKAKILLTDDRGNQTIVRFNVLSLNDPSNEVHTVEPVPGRKLFYADEDNSYLTSDFILRVPGGALYEDINFVYERTETDDDHFADIHQLHFADIPLHKYCNLSIKPRGLPEELHTKAIVLRKSGRSWVSEGGEYKHGLVRSRVRSFGHFTVGIDTIAPKIKAAFIDVSPSGSASFRIYDDMSGITSYRCSLNDKWVLLEYDAKFSKLKGDIPSEYLEESNTLTLVVSDKKGNVATWSKTYSK